MTWSFAILAMLTLAGAGAAMRCRHLVHCALGLVVSFLGLAGLYLQLSATFVGLAQVLVYVGAVGILVVFAILLTRGGGVEQMPLAGPGWVSGLALAMLVAGGLVGAVARVERLEPQQGVSVSVKALGERLMAEYVLPLEALGLLLTAALIGAVVIAMDAGWRDRSRSGGDGGAARKGEAS